MRGGTLAAVLVSVSSAAYRVLKNSEAVLVPREENVCDLMYKTDSDINLRKPFGEIKPKQLLINVLYDEEKLKQALRFSGGYLTEYVEKKLEKLATSATTVL